MARVNEPQKTKYQNISEVISASGIPHYIARWVQSGKNYNKNFTNEFGSTTAKKAYDQLSEVKVLISKGEDPFKKIQEQDLSKNITTLILEEIDNRNVKDNYRYVQKTTYNKHLDPLIGKLTLSELTISVLDDTFKKLQKTVSEDTISTLKKTLNPTLDYAVDEGILEKNPLQSTRLKKTTSKTKASGKAPLHYRLLGKDNNRYLDVIRAFYSAALNFERVGSRKSIPNNEFQLAFLLVAMTGRRRSEVLGIRYEDITSYHTVRPHIDTTKTSVWEEYPLPLEVIDRLVPNGKGKIMPTLTPDMYSHEMRKLLDGLEVKIHADMKIDGHDTRNFFLTIMSKKTKNPFLCDAALSHNTSKYSMLLTYYTPDINDFKELFEDYWNMLRGEYGLEGKLPEAT